MSSLYANQQPIISKLKYPVLIRYKGVEYRYNFIEHHQYIQEKENKEHMDIDNESHYFPYPFMVGILKQYVPYIYKRKTNKKEKVVLSAKSMDKEYVAVLVVSLDGYLLTVHSMHKIPNRVFEAEDTSFYPNLKHHFFSKLDLDKYAENAKMIRSNYEQRLLEKVNKTTIPFACREIYEYKYKITNHAYMKRRNEKGTRLTLPEKVVSNVLRYLVKNDLPYDKLKQKLQHVENEKKVALIFPNRDKSHLVGMLVAFDFRLNTIVVVTVITMYDNVPKEKSAQNLLFPKVDRITLLDYDLDAVMKEYDEAQAIQEKRKDEKLKNTLSQNRKNKNGIKIVSSLDEELSITKATSIDSPFPKIKKVKITKRANKRKETKVLVVDTTRVKLTWFERVIKVLSSLLKVLRKWLYSIKY